MTIEQLIKDKDSVNYVEVISCKEIFPCVEKILNFENKFIIKQTPVVIFEKNYDNSYFKFKKPGSKFYRRCFEYMDIVRYIKFLRRYFEMKIKFFKKKDRLLVKKVKEEIRSVCRGSNVEKKWANQNFNKSDELLLINLYNELYNDIPSEWIKFVPDSVLNLPYTFVFTEKKIQSNKFTTTLKPKIFINNNNIQNKTKIFKTLDLSKLIAYNDKNNISNLVANSSVAKKNSDLKENSFVLRKQYVKFNHSINTNDFEKRLNNYSNLNKLSIDTIVTKPDIMTNYLKTEDKNSKKEFNSEYDGFDVTREETITVEDDETKHFLRNLKKFDSLTKFVKNQHNNFTLSASHLSNGIHPSSKCERNILHLKSQFDNDEISINSTETIISAVIICSIIFLLGFARYLFCKKFNKGVISLKNNNIVSKSILK